MLLAQDSLVDSLPAHLLNIPRKSFNSLLSSHRLEYSSIDGLSFISLRSLSGSLPHTFAA